MEVVFQMRLGGGGVRFKSGWVYIEWIDPGLPHRDGWLSRWNPLAQSRLGDALGQGDSKYSHPSGLSGRCKAVTLDIVRISSSTVTNIFVNRPEGPFPVLSQW